jgi:sigma-E factor negative regulatory protein RseA
MSIGAFPGSAKERLSAMADGELDGPDAAACCSAWGKDAELRAEWHAWHLIGDVLRSEDLAGDPRRDRHLVSAVRTRLQSEPVVLAPTSLMARTSGGGRGLGRAGWRAGAAVAAGLVLVVGTFALVRPGEAPVRTGVALDTSPAAGAAVPAVAAATTGDATAIPVAIVADNRIIRDAQLDRYLEAHKQFAGSSALGLPTVFLRGATVDSAAR